MIVYYDLAHRITGLSNKLDPNKAEPYIETEQSLAQDIFLGKEKIFHYCVEVTDAAAHVGQLIKSVITPVVSKTQSISQYHYAIPKESCEHCEFSISQSVDQKTVDIIVSNKGMNKWISQHQSAGILLLACIPDDPYSVLWSVLLTPNSINKINYLGRDDVTFYTKKLFESYQHVIT
jgi:hypothetical protein